MRVKHENNGDCPKCNEFLKDADAQLVVWFKKEQAANFTLHTSCSIRNRAAQEDAKARGVSKASFGQSPHNYSPSMAIDLFFIIEGNATWPFAKYQELARRKPEGLIWGADWNDNGSTLDEKFKDSPHFEIKGWKSKVKNYPNGNF